jgi:hypothetical protein
MPMSHCPQMRERVTFQFLSCVGTLSLMQLICGTRYVKGLIFLAKSLFSASSCGHAAQGIPDPQQAKPAPRHD